MKMHIAGEVLVFPRTRNFLDMQVKMHMSFQLALRVTLIGIAHYCHAGKWRVIPLGSAWRCPRPGS